MANPNIVNVTTIYGNSSQTSLSTTSATSLVSNAASSGKVYKINSIVVANVDGTNNTEVTVEMASEILADTIGSNKPRQITPTLILEETAKMFGLDVAQLTSKSRTRDLVHARQVGMYVCRELTELSYPQIGKEFGGRDHTTVIHAYDKVSEHMKERRQTYEDVTALIQTINRGNSDAGT